MLSQKHIYKYDSVCPILAFETIIFLVAINNVNSDQ